MTSGYIAIGDPHDDDITVSTWHIDSHDAAVLFPILRHMLGEPDLEAMLSADTLSTMSETITKTDAIVNYRSD